MSKYFALRIEKFLKFGLIAGLPDLEAQNNTGIQDKNQIEKWTKRDKNRKIKGMFDKKGTIWQH